MLGLFGQYGVDAATYWATPGELDPVGLAYWLFRGYGTFFGNTSVKVKLASLQPDTQAIYVSTERGKYSVVIVNKNPSTPIAFDLSQIPAGSYFVRHFGGAAGVAKWQVREDACFERAY
jgi:hypothetical protein